MKFSRRTHRHLEESLREDIGKGDITTSLLVPPRAVGRAVVMARERGVFCGAPVVRELLRRVDRGLRARFLFAEGKPFRANKAVLEIRGRIASILTVERTLLNFLGLLSGIATRTREFANRVRPYGVAILDTRKTLPLWRELAKYAVRAGGGGNHRWGLYDALLVKENHREHGILKKLKRERRPFEIEVRNFRELREALAFRPYAILLDHFPPLRLRRAVRLARRLGPKVRLEASGGVTLQNVRRLARTGVDWISVGSLTQSAKAVDFSLLVK